ncbi:Nit6803 family nitrilase [Pelagicoccus sp. SDUM812003]|uniref:Nit6803 family nitrilase n=1 Tax=Pelagicoccus sp. SDUM812003 TaxID=3041267 RepID=UPI00280D69A6|nr:Nit6803 family nitrilase [Pelagicoccus sp. SDUM812003]MDQ8202175.1 Nit6803 family nitriliase [Pelagicoccus sp. SDUM812003]
MIRAAAIQLAPDLKSGAATVSRMCDAVSDAAKEGARLAVFPETFVPYYPYFSFVEPPVSTGRAHLSLYEEAVLIPGPTTETLSRVAIDFDMVLCVGVNERDGGSLYNTQLIFDTDGAIKLKRRKITPTFHERMIWGRGDGSGLKVVDTAVGKIGALACWEHYNPLARYTLMADGEQIHCSQFPGSMVGQIFADQIEVTIRHHALEAGCFVVNSTGWLSDEQRAALTDDPKMQKALSGGCYSAIIGPDGSHLCEPITEGEGIAIADLDFEQITKRKRMLDSVGHYSRPDLFSLSVNKAPQPAITSLNERDIEPIENNESVSEYQPV